jgi:hypothetical protein
MNDETTQETVDRLGRELAANHAKLRIPETDGPSAGAVRAARLIHDGRYKASGDKHADITSCHVCINLAEIIDRETGVKELLKSLDEAVSEDCPCPICIKVRAAILKAKG